MPPGYRSFPPFKGSDVVVVGFRQRGYVFPGFLAREGRTGAESDGAEPEMSAVSAAQLVAGSVPSCGEPDFLRLECRKPGVFGSSLGKNSY